MKDYTVITKNKEGKFEAKRILNSTMTEEEVKDQLQQLYVSKEQAEDQLDAIKERIRIMEQALEEGHGEGTSFEPGLKH